MEPEPIVTVNSISSKNFVFRFSDIGREKHKRSNRQKRLRYIPQFDGCFKGKLGAPRGNELRES